MSSPRRRSLRVCVDSSSGGVDHETSTAITRRILWVPIESCVSFVVFSCRSSIATKHPLSRSRSTLSQQGLQATGVMGSLREIHEVPPPSDPWQRVPEQRGFLHRVGLSRDLPELQTHNTTLERPERHASSDSWPFSHRPTPGCPAWSGLHQRS